MTEEKDTNEEPSKVENEAENDRFEPKWQKKAGTTKTHEVQAVEPADSTDLPHQLEEAQTRVKDLQDRWHRAAADLSNLRRRTEQERGEIEKFASMLLVQEMLPVLDNFERALATVPGNLAMLTWIHGVMLIERHLQAILEHQGLEPIEAEDKEFNPQLHEAVQERETDETNPGTVLQVYQKGYTMHGRVIRPALVEVAAKTAVATEAQEPAQPAEEEPVREAEAEPTDEAEGEKIAEEAEAENTGP